MPELYALRRLREPTNFLSGWYGPLVHPEASGLWLWADDTLISGPIGGTTLNATLCKIGIDGRLSLDLADPDVARWVDRKIGEHFLGAHAIVLHVAVLGCTPDLFFLVLIGANGEHSELALRPHGILACLRDVPCDEAHLPAARAALLDAIFGVKPT